MQGPRRRRASRGGDTSLLTRPSFAMKSVDENTPLKLAEAGRVGAPDDDVEVQGREPWLGRWKRSQGAAALTVTLLALGACVASAVTATNAPFDAVSLGAGRNRCAPRWR